MRRIQCQSFTRAYPIPKGLQVSRGVRTQAASEGHLRTGAPATGRDLPRAGPAKGMPDYRGTSDARPCAYVHRHSPPTPSSIGDRVSQRKECNRRRSPVKLRSLPLRRAFLGSRLRSIDRRVRIGTGPYIHPRAGGRGWNSWTILKQPIRRATRDA